MAANYQILTSMTEGVCGREIQASVHQKEPFGKFSLMTTPCSGISEKFFNQVLEFSMEKLTQKIIRHVLCDPLWKYSPSPTEVQTFNLRSAIKNQSLRKECGD